MLEVAHEGTSIAVCEKDRLNMVHLKELIDVESKQGCCLVCGHELDVDDVETDNRGKPEADHCPKCEISVHYEVVIKVTKITDGTTEYRRFTRKKNGDLIGMPQQTKRQREMRQASFN